jgi:hypothetical protein
MSLERFFRGGAGIDFRRAIRRSARKISRFGGICERVASGAVNPNRCLSKNIYVFNPRVEANQLFLLALVGLAKSQAGESEMFQIKRLQ